MQHGHLDQVGYDMYCKLLDEVIKEEKGVKVEPDPDIIIDINVSSFIPDNYIENGNQKIEVYQAIALCRTDEDIRKIKEDIEDRFGKAPEEVDSLLEIAKIKQLCKQAGVHKIMQKQENVVFYFNQETFNLDVAKLLEKYKSRIKFSTGFVPYVTYKLEEKNRVVEEIEDFLC